MRRGSSGKACWRTSDPPAGFRDAPLSKEQPPRRFAGLQGCARQRSTQADLRNDGRLGVKPQHMGLLLPSLAFALRSCGRFTLPSRNLHSGGGATGWKHLPDPHDLRAVFPDTTRSRDPAPCGAGLPLLGLSKDAPPSSFVGESTPGSCPRASPVPATFGTGVPPPIRVPSLWSLTTSTVSSSLRWRFGPSGPLPPPCRRCVRVSARFRPWGSSRFGGSGFQPALASALDPVFRFPVMRSCPSKPSLRPQLRRPDQPARRHHLSTAGVRHHHRRSPGRGSRP